MTRRADPAPALPAPPRLTGPEAQAAPPRGWALVGVGLVLAAVTGLTGCGQQTADSGSSATSAARAADADEGAGEAVEVPRVVRLAAGEDRPELTCPTGERSMGIMDYAPGAKGAPSPERALAREDLEDGESLLVDARGSTAWVLRADGTARAQLGLLEVDGWVVDERMSCA